MEKSRNKRFVELIFAIRGTRMKMQGTKQISMNKKYLWG
jgi:hypothetical protein